MAGPLAEVSRMPGLLVARLADASVAQLEQASVATLEALRLSSAYRMVLMKNSPFSVQAGQDVLLAHEISDRFYLCPDCSVVELHL
jgi:hypothetical protein